MTLFEIIVSVAPLMISYMAGTLVISIYALKSWEKQGGETFLGYEMDLIANIFQSIFFATITYAMLVIALKFEVAPFIEIVSLGMLEKVIIGFAIGCAYEIIGMLIATIRNKVLFGRETYNERLDIPFRVFGLLYVPFCGIALFYLVALYLSN